MIRFISGNIFDLDADIMVNTVNCVGVMGAGVALAFKKRYPEMFADYQEQCRAGKIRPGQPTVWTQTDIVSKEVEIVNFPTKDDWRKPSEYPFIEEGLDWLAAYLESKRGMVVALPALGCGHGGLDWEKVQAIILEKLGTSPAEIYVFAPTDSRRIRSSVEVHNKTRHLLSSLNIGIAKPANDRYPEELRRSTVKELLFFPDDDAIFSFDVTLICSTKPTAKEADLIRRFCELCAFHGRSVLFGPSSFEKKLCLEFAENGGRCGCFIPSGIYDAVKKIGSRSGKLTLLSAGDPFKTFDKSEFLPSVLSRLRLSKVGIFMTQRIAWTSKYKSSFAGTNIYFYSWESLPQADQEAARSIDAKKLGLDVFTSAPAFDYLFQQHGG